MTLKMMTDAALTDDNIFSKPLIELLEKLHRRFEPRRAQLLQDRKIRQKAYDDGAIPDYLDRESIAASSVWKVNPIPPELNCRRVEITGPVNSAKMVISMLSRTESGDRADMAMLDFEDSMRPTFANVVHGYKNVIGAVSGKLSFKTPEKTYSLNSKDMAYVMVRVRGLHLDETHVEIDGQPIAAGLMDLVVNFFHTAKIYRDQNKTPKYYVPKCEHHLEARWWNDLFTDLEKEFNYPVGTLRATFLIETLPATFQIEEILYEIRDHAVGLNVGRWDKIFSDIKVLRNHKNRIMPDRGTITMDRIWMENYAKRVIKICHDRGAFAMGGMSAFTPGKTPELRKEQTNKVIQDKKREASWGHDGCWVSHPYFIGPAMKAFKNKNQLNKKLNDFDKYPDIHPQNIGPHTLHGLRTNIRVGIAYLHGWNAGLGCVSYNNLMEDLATLEISRAQTWQWLHHQITLDDGMKVTKDLILKSFDDEYETILKELGPKAKVDLMKAKTEAANLFTQETLQDFFH